MLKYYVYADYWIHDRYRFYNNMEDVGLEYGDVLNWLFEQFNLCYAGCKIRYVDLVRLFKFIRHCDNDGDWSGGYNENYYRTVRTYDENGKLKVDRELYKTEWIPRTFKRKPIIIIDSYGRIVNSKDLLRDMQKHVYDSEWRRKYNKRRHRINYVFGTSRWQRGGWWHKYAGNHGGILGEARDLVYHEIEQKEILEEYGTTFKIRKERSKFLKDWYSFDRNHGRFSKGRGWKRQRIKKQWMRGVLNKKEKVS
jgi:hypothetical protein